MVKENLGEIETGVEETVKEVEQNLKSVKQREVEKQTAAMVKAAKDNSLVLNAFRVEKVGNDAILWERVIVPEHYAGQKGVKEFTATNGRVTYYVERQAKRYSDNVVKS